nr:reverse transcriptase domain-containing protein [Tanacetum cinerariifolium]
MGYEHFSTTLVTNKVTESSTKYLVPIPRKSEVTSDNGSESLEPVKDDSSVFMTFLNSLFDNDEINSNESTSNHDTDNDSQREEIDIVTSTDYVLPTGVENDYSDGEVDAVDDLRVDNSILNSEHEFFESEEFDFDNPSVPLPPPKPPDEEFNFEIDFGDEISVAYKNSLIYKERTKKLHDDKIKNRIFNVGDQVLLFNSRIKIFSGKLKSRWSGPFTISEIYPYGTAKLIHPDGCNFKVNCHCLKHYHGGDPPPLEIPD